MKETDVIKVENNPSKLEKWGGVFSKFVIICLILGSLAFASIILLPLVWLLGFLLILVTLGFIFALIPGYWSKLTGFGDTINKIGDFFLRVGPYVAGAGIAFCIMAILCFSLDKNKKHVKKIVLLSISLVLFIVGLIFILIKR